MLPERREVTNGKVDRELPVAPALLIRRELASKAAVQGARLHARPEAEAADGAESRPPDQELASREQSTADALRRRRWRNPFKIPPVTRRNLRCNPRETDVVTVINLPN